MSVQHRPFTYLSKQQHSLSTYLLYSLPAQDNRALKISPDSSTAGQKLLAISKKKKKRLSLVFSWEITHCFGLKIYWFKKERKSTLGDRLQDWPGRPKTSQICSTRAKNPFLTLPGPILALNGFSQSVFRSRLAVRLQVGIRHPHTSWCSAGQGSSAGHSWVLVTICPCYAHWSSSEGGSLEGGEAQGWGTVAIGSARLSITHWPMSPHTAVPRHSCQALCFQLRTLGWVCWATTQTTREAKGRDRLNRPFQELDFDDLSGCLPSQNIL